MYWLTSLCALIHAEERVLYQSSGDIAQAVAYYDQHLIPWIWCQRPVKRQEYRPHYLSHEWKKRQKGLHNSVSTALFLQVSLSSAWPCVFTLISSILVYKTIAFMAPCIASFRFLSILFQVRWSQCHTQLGRGVSQRGRNFRDQNRFLSPRTSTQKLMHWLSTKNKGGGSDQLVHFISLYVFCFFFVLHLFLDLLYFTTLQSMLLLLLIMLFCSYCTNLTMELIGIEILGFKICYGCVDFCC